MDIEGWGVWELVGDGRTYVIWGRDVRGARRGWVEKVFWAPGFQESAHRTD